MTFDVIEMQPSPPCTRKAGAAVSSPDSKRNRGSCQNAQALRPGEIAGRIPQADELRRFRQPRDGLVGKLAHRAGRDVVQDDRQPRVVGDRTEVHMDAGPAWACCSTA